MIIIAIIGILLSFAIIKKQDDNQKETLRQIERLKLRIIKLESRYEMMTRSERKGLSEL